MNTKEIEDLLEKYYEGLTSLEEEKQLCEFFLEDIVPSYLAPYADLFRSFAESRQEEISDPEFEEKFLKAIEETPVISMYSKKRRLIYITGLAAGVLLLIGLFFTFTKDVFTKPPKNTITNPDLAYAETQKALLMLSENFHTGISQIEKLQAFDKGIEQLQNLQRFDQGILQVQKFSEFYKFQKLVFNPDEKIRP